MSIKERARQAAETFQPIADAATLLREWKETPHPETVGGKPMPRNLAMFGMRGSIDGKDFMVVIPFSATLLYEPNAQLIINQSVIPQGRAMAYRLALKHLHSIT